MNKLIKTLCLLLVFVSLLQGCSNKKDDNDKNDAKEGKTTSSTTLASDSSAVSQPVTSQAKGEKTTVILNAPTKATTTTAATTTSSAETTTSAQKPAGTDDIKKDANGLTYIKGILVVNKTYSIPSTYNPGVNAEAQTAFNQMAAAASKEGLTLSVVSGFRSYTVQQNLYNNYVAQDGKANADRYSARPGHSEHQTGLAFDVNSVSQSFENTAEGKWLAANCSKYGFIIRFPKGKESITGYMYEPWHIRYLGVSTAEAIQKSGLTLEEYLGINSVYAN